MIDRNVGWPKDRVTVEEMFTSLKKKCPNLKKFEWISKVSDMYLSNLAVHINQKNNVGDTIFHLAAELSDGRVLSFILNKTKNIDEKNRLGETPLHRACKAGNKKTIQLLLLNNANVDAKTNKGDTPLMYLCRYNCTLELIKHMLVYSPNLDIENDEEEKALDICQNHTTNKKIIKLLHPIYRQL